MVSLVQINAITRRYGADVLFEDLSLGIAEGDKIGLIARNGAGKSSLLDIVAGVQPPDAGTVVTRNDLRVGYLPQLPQFAPHLTVLEACVGGEPELEQAAREFLTRLKIDDLNQPVKTLSGGQVKRVALAGILAREPQLLILDEPTNHLDIDIIEWLENYLSRSTMSLLMVTHDRYFLDNICNRIIELDQRRLYSYDGNYAYYLEKRAERLEAQSAAVERARNLLRTELEWMRRQPQARAHKARYRIDAFYDLQARASARREGDEDVRLDVGGASYIGNKIFTAHDVSFAYGDNVIVNHLNYTFARYEKLGIVGNNGVGKTTLIRLLLGELKPDAGHFEVGQTVRWGYYSQHGMTFAPDKRVIDAVRDVAEEVYFDERTHYTAAQLLNLFLFDNRDQQKLVSTLSGGERRRLYLAVVLMAKPNFLILDEPTNDLDISTLEVLEQYLMSFKGCVIIVSHDRFFMDRTVDHTFVMNGNGDIKDFPGNYSEYRAWARAHATASSAAPTSAKSTKRREPSQARRLTYKEQRELEALTAQIDALTAERQALDNLFASGEPIPDIDVKSQRYVELRQLLDDKEMRWLELSELNG